MKQGCSSSKLLNQTNFPKHRQVCVVHKVLHMIPHHTNLSQHKIKQTRQWLHWNWHLKWGNRDLSKVQGKVKREAQTRFIVEEMKEWGGGLGAEKIKTAPTKCTRVIWRNWKHFIYNKVIICQPNVSQLLACTAWRPGANYVIPLRIWTMIYGQNQV